ncbi:hypothetical protein Pan258_35120 [Symmachiella dynata]|nr:hypothetical protein Pan258_35120 [Symmachiella dynata]
MPYNEGFQQIQDLVGVNPVEVQVLSWALFWIENDSRQFAVSRFFIGIRPLPVRCQTDEFWSLLFPMV